MKPREQFTIGTATAKQNPLTGNWLVYGQKDSYYPYVCENKREARRMAKTVDHYNRTGEIKAF
jgi:hypothetical protein